MINCTGLIKVFRLEDADRYTKAKGVYGIPPQKGKDGAEWENDFINLTFLGTAFKKVKDVEEKDTIYIKSGILRNREYTNHDGDTRTWTEIKIFEFCTKEQAEAEGLLKPKSDKSEAHGESGNAPRSGNRRSSSSSSSNRGGKR